MAGESLLEMATEVAVAFAGFVSIFLVLARRDGSFSPSDSFRIRTIVLASMGGVFYGAFPLVLHTAGLAEAMVWRISSLVALLGFLLAVPYFFRLERMLSTTEHRALGSVNTVIAWSVNVVAIGLHLSNVLAVFGEPAAGLYVAAWWLTMATAATNFVTLVFQRLLAPTP